MTALTRHRERILAWIEEDRDALVAFLSGFVAIPSPNPPGDTRAAATFLSDALRAQGVPVETRALEPHLPNVVGSFAGARPGRHLVLNGHVDVFPAGPSESWSRDPWSGEVADGKVHGRGVVDMKCGTAASAWTYIYLHRLRGELPGRLTLACVSDEETGGTRGSKWLVEAFPGEFLGDCCLNGEPSTPLTIRFGEKGTLRLVFDVDTPGAHAAYTHASRNAIRVAAALVGDLAALEEMEIATTSDVRAAIESSRAAMDRALGAGAGAILDRITVSPGVIQGGLKINMLPGHCRVEVDMRLPVGCSQARALEAVRAIVARHPEARMTHVTTHSSEPSACAPGHPMVSILQATVRGLTGETPAPAVSLGATDAKFWRHRGTPAYVYGCTPNNMAKPDEWVAIEEYLHVVRTHAIAAATYLETAS